jgi:hypothetical protein
MHGQLSIRLEALFDARERRFCLPGRKKGGMFQSAPRWLGLWLKNWTNSCALLVRLWKSIGQTLRNTNATIVGMEDTVLNRSEDAISCSAIFS